MNIREGPGIEVTREDLYRQVWETPMMHLADKYGVSNVALAKICKRLNIPKPSLGYWRQVDFKCQAPPEPLPPAGPDTPLKAVIHGAPDLIEPATPRLRFPADSFRVRQHIQTWHPLVAKTRDELRSSSPHPKTRLLICQRAGYFDVCVTRRQVSRAMRILDALVRGATAMGWEVVAPEWKHCGIKVNGYLVYFRLVEKLTQRLNEMQSVDATKYVQVPNGKLQLAISNWTYSSRTCTDDRDSPLESKLRLFAGHIAATADTLKRYEMEEAERERRRAEEAERAWKEKQRQEAMHACENRFYSAAAEWEQYQDAKRFLARCRFVLRAAGINLAGHSAQAKWFRWIKKKIEMDNPFKQGFPFRESVAEFLAVNRDGGT